MAGPGGHDGWGESGVWGGGDPSTQPRVCVTVVMVRGSQGVGGLAQVQVGGGLDHIGLGSARPVVDWGGGWRGALAVAQVGYHPPVITLTASLRPWEDRGHYLLQG